MSVAVCREKMAEVSKKAAAGGREWCLGIYAKKRKKAGSLSRRKGEPTAIILVARVTTLRNLSLVSANEEVVRMHGLHRRGPFRVPVLVVLEFY